MLQRGVIGVTLGLVITMVMQVGESAHEPGSPVAGAQKPALRDILLMVRRGGPPAGGRGQAEQWQPVYQPGESEKPDQEGTIYVLLKEMSSSPPQDST